MRETLTSGQLPRRVGPVHPWPAQPHAPGQGAARHAAGRGRHAARRRGHADQPPIVDYRWIAAGLVIGTVIGYPLGMWVPMTAMPQRIALSLSFGALAAALVGIAEYYTAITAGELAIALGKMAALGFEVLLGSLTVTGTLMPFGKLQEWLPSKPVTYRGQNLVNGAAVRSASSSLLVTLIVRPEPPSAVLRDDRAGRSSSACCW